MPNSNLFANYIFSLQIGLESNTLFCLRVSKQFWNFCNKMKYRRFIFKHFQKFNFILSPTTNVRDGVGVGDKFDTKMANNFF